MMNAQGKSPWQSCSDMGGLEYPEICGPCAPGSQPEEKDDNGGDDQKADILECSPCTLEQCDSDLNRCPVCDRTCVCTKGLSVEGCNGTPWARILGSVKLVVS